MADQDRTDRVKLPMQAPDEERTKVEENSITPQTGMNEGLKDQPARPDPETGEIPAGPGDAGLERRPKLNAGSPGTRQMSNRRLGVGLGITVLLAALVLILAAML
jgi:hypothetical protein